MKPTKIFYFFAILFSLTFSITAQNFADTHQQIRTAVENRNYTTAIDQLKKLSEKDKKIFTLNNYDYLLARMSEKNGDMATAMANYQAVVNRKSVLTEYALWHLAEISRSTGNYMLQRVYLRELATVAPNSLLNDATNARIARSYFESEDYKTAITALRSNLKFSNTDSTEEISFPTNTPEDIFGTLTKNDARTRDNLVLLGQVYLQNGNTEEASQVFRKLAEDLPNPDQPDDFALAGIRGLDEIAVGKENFGKTVPELSEDEHFERAEIYQFNWNFDSAKLHYEALIKRFPESSKIPKAMYQIGRGFVRKRDFGQAVQWFERIQAEFPESPFAQEALYQSAAAYARINKPSEAISRYQKYIEKYPNARNLERAYLNIIDVLRDQGETTSALKWTAAAQERFKGKLPEEAVALFAQTRIHLSQKDWKQALADLNKLQEISNLGGVSVAGGTNKEEIAFLKGYVLEKLEQFDEAIGVYLSIPEGRKEYYGWRATERLRDLYKNEETKKFVENRLSNLQRDTYLESRKSIYRIKKNQKTLGEIRSLYSTSEEYSKIPKAKLLDLGRNKVRQTKSQFSGNIHQHLAEELLFLGLYDEGTPELETALSENQTPLTEDQKFTLAVYYKRGDIANRATAYIEPKWRKIPDDYQIEIIPREQIELLYPTPYKDSLVKFASTRNVDPRFVLSIMRQESRFRADVKSVAAARGLMQFITPTANQIAAEVGKNNFRQDDLYNPPTAILFGSQYMANLYKMFPGQHQAVAASYNGGEDNMERWLARANSNEPDRYVPEILYSQTKDYVYRVMQNFRIYQMLYDEKLDSKN